MLFSFEMGALWPFRFARSRTRSMCMGNVAKQRWRISTRKPALCAAVTCWNVIWLRKVVSIAKLDLSSMCLSTKASKARLADFLQEGGMRR